MRKKIFALVFMLAVVAFPFCMVGAVKNGALIMSPNSTKAYFYDGTYVSGVSLVSDSGRSGPPYISSFGNVYVSTEHLYKVIGGADDSYTYNKQQGTLLIKLNGKKTEVPVGKKFMVRNDERSEVMFVYEIGDDLYIPARLAALVCGGSVSYNAETKDIVFFTNNDIKADVTAEDGSIKPSFKNKLYDTSYMNNVLKNNKYVLPDGSAIESVANAECVFREGTDVFYVKDYRLYSEANGADAKQLELKDAAGNKITAYICSAAAAGGKLYGIAAPQPTGKTGRLFSCEYNGSNFRYVSNLSVSGLLLQRADKSDYLYYISGGRESKICVYDTSGDDEYVLVIQDKTGKPAVGSAERFGIMNNGLFTVSADKKTLTLLRFDRPAYECEWIKIRNDNKISVIDGYDDKNKFSDIVCANYNPENSMIYIADKSDGVCRLISVNTYTAQVNVIKEYQDDITNICLYKTADSFVLSVEKNGAVLDVLEA